MSSQRVIGWFKGDDDEDNEDINIDNENDGAHLFQRYTRIDSNTLDYLNSEHSMAMQNSKYVQVENNKKRILRQKFLMRNLT